MMNGTHRLSEPQSAAKARGKADAKHIGLDLGLARVTAPKEKTNEVWGPRRRPAVMV